jgi:hypothetical protein
VLGGGSSGQGEASKDARHFSSITAFLPSLFARPTRETARFGAHFRGGAPARLSNAWAAEPGRLQSIAIAAEK